MDTRDTTFSLMLFNWAMDLKEAADSYAKATAEFLKVAQELGEAQLDSSSSGGWTARQIIHHVICTTPTIDRRTWNTNSRL
jgi:hypothetical protein